MVYTIIHIMIYLCLTHTVTWWGHIIDDLDNYPIITVVFVYFMSRLAVVGLLSLRVRN